MKSRRLPISPAGPTCCSRRVGVSIGIAYSAEGSFDPDELLRQADAAMYEAKLRRKAATA